MEAKLRRHKRAQFHKCKASKRREFLRPKVLRAARRLANARKAWQHRTRRRLAAEADTILIGKAEHAGKTRSVMGTEEAPGTSLRAKAGLNREILITGRATMEEMLSYRVPEPVKEPAAYTSRTCSAYGPVDADSRSSQASFKCVGVRIPHGVIPAIRTYPVSF